ncbi:MAG: Holliday junction resolvase RuvX [Granulosicoccus sp.]
MKQIEPCVGTCIAFDYGTKRIGTAVGEGQLQTARPLSTIVNRNGLVDWPAVAALLDEWQPTDLIVGWPLDNAGEEQIITGHVRGFIRKLEKQFNLPVHRVDERFSSLAAQSTIRNLRQSGQRKRRSTHADVDAIAAALILESWFADPEHSYPR